MKKINIAELLKDCPKGMELDCALFNNPVTLVEVKPEVYDYPITIKTLDEVTYFTTKYGQYSNENDAKCIIFPKGKTTWEGFHRPFRDGDIVVGRYEDIHLLRSEDSSCCSLWKTTLDDTITTNVKVIRFATEEEKEKLFQAIKDNGYKWNEETKTLEKLIQNKFDIPFESKVLVRNNDNNLWKPAIFGFKTENKSLPFYVLGGTCWKQCIPYEGNEHLLGNTGDCDEFYKTWEEKNYGTISN